ncbi:MAG TPA: transketolase [Steroidobacteraceae bacterium]|jgi:transketolase|nr:transketolase [Steroidobacteraceae bacterium]
MNDSSHTEPATAAELSELRSRATRLRRHMLTMASGRGQGYLGQGLGIADLMAALYFHEMKYDPQNPKAPGRDRFVMSTGHYSIALWAALVEAGTLPAAELSTYGADDSRLEMSTLDTTPGVEIIGGSLGHGLGQAAGIALALKTQGSSARVFVELSDGEMQEGSTWEAAMAISHFGLDNLVALVDCNGIQADGPIVMRVEPVADKWRAFGWEARDIDGNDIAAIVDSLHWGRATAGVPHVIVLRTTPGKGIPTLERREKAHFVRIESSDWAQFEREFEALSKAPGGDAR